jgi:Vitelline membrane outer layer protein I (VOMI)
LFSQFLFLIVSHSFSSTLNSLIVNFSDTALNGLQIRCANKDFSGQEDIIVENGIWGNWKGMQVGNGRSMVQGAQVRFEDSQGGGE